MEFEGMEWSLAPFAEGEMQLSSALYEKLEDDILLYLLSPLVLSSSKSPASLVIPPSLPVLPTLPITVCSSALPLLFPSSPPALPLTPLCSVDLPQVFRSPAPSRKEDPLASPPAAKPVTPLWLVNLPSSTFDSPSLGSLRPYGSTGLPCPSGSA